MDRVLTEKTTKKISKDSFFCPYTFFMNERERDERKVREKERENEVEREREKERMRER